jgi:small-conductance mechanosensitive channel
MADETASTANGSIDILGSAVDLSLVYEKADAVRDFVANELFTIGSLVELGVIAVSCLLAMATDGWFGKIIASLREKFFTSVSETKMRKTMLPILFAFMWLLWASVGRYGLGSFGQNTALTTVAVNLLVAWVVIRTLTNVLAEPFWAQSVAIIAWTIAALNIFGLLNPVVTFLDAFAIQAGDTRLSVTLVIKAIGLIVLLLWGASLISAVLQRRINSLPALTPSLQILIGKVSRIVLIALAFFIGLTSLGIDLSIFAVLGGAVGIGVGFGLQKIVGNFVSGLILLMDRSIKPGDVIEVAGTYGWVRSLGARYTSVVTRDGHEHLIPNEDFIVNTVTNWSFSDKNVRVKKPIGVSYNTDIRLAQKLVIEAAMEVDRVLKDPAPQCHLKNFGDNSVDLEVRFWLDDPESGTANVTSKVLLGIWDKFQENNIEIPYPQHDVHIKEMPGG